MSHRRILYANPTRHKLAILSFFGLLGPVYFIPSAVEMLLGGPRILVVCAAVAMMVILMTYVIMPVITHLASGWLTDKSAEGPFRKTKV